MSMDLTPNQARMLENASNARDRYKALDGSKDTSLQREADRAKQEALNTIHAIADERGGIG